MNEPIYTAAKRETLQKALCRLLKLHSSKNEHEYMVALEEFVEAKIKEQKT